MNKFASRMSKIATFTFLGMALISCGLPSAGPSKSKVLQGSFEQQGDALVVPVTRAVIATSNYSEKLSFGSNFLTAGGLNTDVVRSGDVLVLTVYENVEQGVLGTAGVPSQINQLQVDRTGHIFVPFAGRIKASGKTTETLRMDIQTSLAEQTPDPQVQLARVEGEGSSVTVIGTTSQGVYPISQATTHLSGIIARAGGVTGDPATTIVTVQRGERTGKIWLQDLYNNPINDIHLRPGDRVVLSNDLRSFNLLGEVNNQGLAKFTQPVMSALDAIALGGGLNSSSANPTGIFVLRNERPDIASRLYEAPDFTKSRRVVYQLNLVDPNGLFLAKDFTIRNGDTVYVTVAPYTQFTKILSQLVTPISSGARAAGALGVE